MDTPTIHKFEKAGLGTAPFRVVGFKVMKYQAIPGDPNCPIQPGGSCDYCGTAIMNAYQVKGSGAEDLRFKVGCDCVAKTGDKGMIKQVESAERKRKAGAAKKAKLARIRRTYALLTRADMAAELAAAPSPWRDSETRADWAAWMIRNAGATGKTEVAKYVERIAKAAGTNPRKVAEGDKDAALAALEPAEVTPEPTPEPEPTPDPALLEWVGTEGERMTTDATVDAVIDIEGRYGTSTLYKLADADGNQLAWFCSGRRPVVNPDRPMEYDGTDFFGEGDRVTLTGTVKTHGHYDGQRQTTLTRCKLVAL